MIVPSSLVKEPTQLAADRRPPLRSRWSPKARRWYQRLLSGLTHHQAQGRILRVMTLTTAPRALERDLNADFQALKKRILRKWPCKFDYWKLRTSEGNGVLHIIYSGIYIPVAWIKQAWSEVHGGSYIVYMQKLRGKRKSMVNYLMGHYLPAHASDLGIYTRMSWSWGWVFRGFAGAWRWFWKRGPSMADVIFDWTRLMMRADPLFSYNTMRGRVYQQTVLKKRGIRSVVAW